MPNAFFRLSKDEFASLREIALGLILGAPPVPVAHLSKLLGLGYIHGVMGGFVPTGAGARRLANGQPVAGGLA